MASEKILLPNGKLLETRENWLYEVEPLERKIIRGDLEFVALLNDFRVIVPVKDYPFFLRVPDFQEYFGNHFEMGLFGWMGYWINKNGQTIDICTLSAQRLAHLHYPYKERPIFVDIGNYQYAQLLKQLKTEAIPKDCQLDCLFKLMELDLMALAGKELRK